jgi:hypothetical protein
MVIVVVTVIVVADGSAVPMVIEAKGTEVVGMGSAAAVSASGAPWAPVVLAPVLAPILPAVTEASALAHQSVVGNTAVGA